MRAADSRRPQWPYQYCLSDYSQAFELEIIVGSGIIVIRELITILFIVWNLNIIHFNIY